MSSTSPSVLSCDHFSVDGTLIEAWADLARGHAKQSLVGGSGGIHEELQAKDDQRRRSVAGQLALGGGRNVEVDFHGERRGVTHASTSDPNARLYRKGCGREVRLGDLGQVLMEDRNGLIVGAVRHASTAMPSATPPWR